MVFLFFYFAVPLHPVLWSWQIKRIIRYLKQNKLWGKGVKTWRVCSRSANRVHPLPDGTDSRTKLRSEKESFNFISKFARKPPKRPYPAWSWSRMQPFGVSFRSVGIECGACGTFASVFKALHIQRFTHFSFSCWVLRAHVAKCAPGNTTGEY